MHRVGDLDVDQDLDIQKKEWVIRRTFLVVMAVILLLGMTGLFGTGPLSSATAGDAGEGLALGYERFVRHGGESSLEFEIHPDQVADGQVELWISSSYLDDLIIEQYSIQPDQVRAQGDRHVFVFLAEDPGEPITLGFSIRPDTIGRLSGEAGIIEGPTFTFNQFSYP